MYILEPATACSAFCQRLIARLRKEPGGTEDTKGKLLSTGYLQALEVLTEIRRKSGSKEKTGCCSGGGCR